MTEPRYDLGDSLRNGDELIHYLNVGGTIVRQTAMVTSSTMTTVTCQVYGDHPGRYTYNLSDGTGFTPKDLGRLVKKGVQLDDSFVI